MRWGPQLRPLDPHCPSTSLQDTTEGTMNANDVASKGLGLISRLADEASSVAMVAGYVALGAAVVIGRSLLDTARQTWKRLPSLRSSQRYQERGAPKAA